MGRSYADRDLKLLFGKSGMYCAFPGCRNRLLAKATDVDDEANLSYIAHIVAHSDSGPRADPSLPEPDRNKYPNLVLLCGHHHTLVDAQDSEYTVEDLRTWKASIESWVEERLTEGMRDIRFAELEVICNALVNGRNSVASTGLVAVTPADKMEHNELTEESAYRMTLGLMQAPQVASYLQEISSRIDPTFPMRLRRGFVGEYETLRTRGLTGDGLFFAMHQFAFESSCPADAGMDERFTLKSAALAVLCHLFEVCDVFEAPAHATS
ncbi:HNH endonuclease signature motif containing protein [Nocardia gipuzkoensis]